jgi:protein-tyrosine phosphatase/L-amino acid N-acyltransferase YncA
MAIAVRPARLDDVPAIASVHVRAWQAAYEGIVPESYLRALSIDERAARWRTILTEATATTSVAIDGDTLVGWASFGKCRDADTLPTDGELWAIYVGPEAWSRGAGCALWEHARIHLSDAGFHEAVVWAFEANVPAHRFYARHGFVREAGARRFIEIHGIAIPEVRRRIGLHAPVTRRARLVEIPDIPGTLALRGMPGRGEPLAQSWDGLRRAQIQRIVCLVAADEIATHVRDYADALAAKTVPCPVDTFPIPDFGVPRDRDAFRALASDIATRLEKGEHVAIHCGAGIGRSGMLATCVLLALGLSLDEAIARVTAAGSHPETPEQQAIVAWCAEVARTAGP